MGAVRGLADAVMFWGRALERTHVGDRPLDVPAFVAASPVDPERFAPSPEKRAGVRAELGIPAGAPVLGLVGNLNPQKGLEHFVAAAQRVGRERPDAWFVVAGARMPTHAAYLAEVEEQIGAAGLRERLLVLGERDDVDAVLAALDVLLITSVPASEGIPTVALEAMATGVPVVTTDVGAAAEAVRDGATGAVVPPLDPDAIAAAALALLADEPGRAGQGRAGREHVLREFSLDRIAELHATAFGAARDRARSRRAPGLAIVQGTIRTTACRSSRCSPGASAPASRSGRAPRRSSRRSRRSRRCRRGRGSRRGRSSRGAACSGSGSRSGGSCARASWSRS